MDELFEVRKSKISGKGVFAKKEIKKNTTICFMTGEQISIEEMIRRVDEDLEYGSDPLGVDDEQYIDLDEIPRSFNHSCEPNSYHQGNPTL